MELKFTFNLKKAAIFQAIKLERSFLFAKLLKKLFLVLFILFFLFFLYGFLAGNFPQDFNSKLLGLSITLLTLTVCFQLKLLFFDLKIKKPKLKITIAEAIANPNKHNLAEFLSYETASAVWKSTRSTKNSTRLFYNLIKDNPDLNFIFSRAILSLDKIKKELKNYLKKNQSVRSVGVKPQHSFQEIILEALKIAQKKKRERVEVGDMLTVLAEYDSVFKKILIDAELKAKDIENLTWWQENLKEKNRERKRFWEWKNLIKMGSIAKEWTTGYTITLNKFSIDLSELLKKNGFSEIIGHRKEIKSIERVLARKEINNVLLVGEPGVGRKSIIQELAKKSFLGESLPEINHKRIIVLDIPALSSKTANQEQTQAILDKIFQETIAAGNVILVINNFHNFIGVGQIDISGIISSYLSLPEFQIIAITTYQGLHKYIEQKPMILDLFERVEVSKISEIETLMVLEKSALSFERKYRKFISYPAIREIVALASKYLSALPFPKKAIGILDEAMVYISRSSKDKILLPEHISKIISEKTQIPIGKIETKEKEILLNLEDLIHQRIINQDKAVQEVAASLRRARAEVQVQKGPMGCFLFLGPTGVGKTETSKALTEIYFGSLTRMIRMDMSEFQNISDIPRLIGSPGNEGLLTTNVRENPFSLILLDEIEKAHPNILNLFLQVLDEGFLTDGIGRKVDFKNSIIIATSNAGYKVILEALNQKTKWSEVKQKLLNYLFEKAIFRPEFINRFDSVIVFSPLSKNNLLDISELMLQKLKKNLKGKDIEFIINLPLKEKIVELGYSPIFGAREMKRVIQDKVENVLASALLSGELKRGDIAEVKIEAQEFKLKIN